MSFGNMPVDGGSLLLSASEHAELGLDRPTNDLLVRRAFGSAEYIRGIVRYCLWIDDENLPAAKQNRFISDRIERVKVMRLGSRDKGTKSMAAKAHQFREMNSCENHVLIVPSVSSETREYFPVGLLDSRSTITNLAFDLYTQMTAKQAAPKKVAARRKKGSEA